MKIKKNWKYLMALVLSVAMLMPAQAAYATEGQAAESGVEAYAESRAADADGFVIEDGVLKEYTGTATDMVIPEGVTSIDQSAIIDNTKITSIVFPESLRSIGDSAFAGFYALEKIHIPKGVESIGEHAFVDCWALKAISVDKGNTVYDSRGDCNALIETESNTLILGCPATIIPDGVTSIGDYAFHQYYNMTEIDIPKGVESIGVSAFFGCGLRKISFPDEIASIETNAFGQCTDLREINIPKGMININSSVFEACYKVNTITVDERNPVYDSRGNCNALIETESNTLIIGCANTIIPSSVTKIGDRAFFWCQRLMEIDIPEGVTSIGDSAFAQCGLVRIDIPESVTSIGKTAFYGCGSLEEIRIPERVTSIGESAFSLCMSLVAISIPESVVDIGKSAFWTSSKELTVYGKAGSYAETYANREKIAFSTEEMPQMEKKRIISDSDVSLSHTSYIYDGTEKKPKVTVRDGNKILVEGSDYSVTYSKNTDAGIAEAMVHGAGNYAGYIIKEFIIIEEKKELSQCVVTVSQDLYAYDGKAKKPAVTVKDGNKVLAINTDYTVDYSNNINAGTAKVIVTGKGNYTGTVIKEFIITEAPALGQEVKELSKCTITISQTSYTYDGKAKKPTVTVKDGAAILKEGTDYIVTYENNINAGTAKVTVTGKGNYEGTVTKTFTIAIEKGTIHKVGSFQYRVTGTSTVSATGVKESKIAKVKVPKTVKIGGKNFKVTAIGSSAFKNNKKITGVEIGDNVKFIGTSAFEGCTKLTKVTVGKGVVEIGGSAFKNCKKLGTVMIKSANLKKVGKNALKGMRATAKIKVPAKKLSVYKNLFKNKGQNRKVKIVK